VIRRLAFLTARAGTAAICLLTWGYGVTTYSPFAFDMFVRPQLFPPLVAFVAWHHVWFWIAFLLSAATLVPDLTATRRGPAFWAAVGYLAVMTAVGVHLTTHPYLATLSSGSRSLAVVPGALVPIAWLAVIDHLAADRAWLGRPPGPGTGQRQLLTACLMSGVLLWSAHLLRGWLLVEPPRGWPSMADAAWTLTLDVGVLLGVYVVLSLASAMAAATARAVAWEYALGVVIGAAAITELGRRVVLPAFSFSSGDAGAIALALGVALAAMWSGLRLRGARRDAGGGFADLLSIVDPQPPARAVIVLGAILLTASLTLTRVNQFDWANLLQSLVALVEATLILGVMLARQRRDDRGEWSLTAALAPPVIALALLLLLPSATARLATATTDPRVHAKAVIDRLPFIDALASFAAERLVAQPQFDVAFYQELLASETRQPVLDPAAPAATLARPFVPQSTRPPHVFVLIIDSLRRDYLSPYNPAVTFTPAIDAWARDSFVFRNAFTPYGGTWLAMPSLWTGSIVTRGWGRIFPGINTLESLIVGADYDLAINDFTIADLLKPATARTFLSPEIPSVDTDLCTNLDGLQAHMAARATARPVFGYLAPMNVHILNTRIGSLDDAGRYPGFFSPYASRLERIDRCFGRFLAHLKAQGLYDDSIIILTSDHGDSLGADGRWGHQFFLFPEDIRIPLIVSLPRAQRAAVTADLSRVAFLTDVTPTLLALLGQPVPDLGPSFGSPLFVPSDRTPVPRRRDSFLVMSSYGSTYGLLRRNGRSLYISDLLNWREYAYELFTEPLGERRPVTQPLRHLSQAAITRHVQRVEDLYRRQ
jgi:hypothetical protein